MRKRLYILGADDPEMSLIEKGLRNAKQLIAYATVGGKRVAPFNAYEPEDLRFADSKEHEFLSVVLVECSMPACLEGAKPELIIDHHRPGDPGFGEPPEKFWEASSIGQLFAHAEREGFDLGLDMHQAKLAAAADHCLGAAYKGRCPGINVEDLVKFRAETKAKFKRIPVDAVLDDFKKAAASVRALDSIDLLGQTFKDAIGININEFPEGLSIEGVCGVYSFEDGRSGKVKVGVLNGEPEEVRAFQAAVSNCDIFESPYGDPARGFAGAFVPAGTPPGEIMEALLEGAQLSLDRHKQQPDQEAGPGM